MSWLLLHTHTLASLLAMEKTLLIDHFGNTLVRQDSVVLVIDLFFCPIWLISKVLNDSLYFYRDFHLWTIGALQILGYEDLLQSCEVSNIIITWKGKGMRK